ncbi:Elongation factor Ts [Arsenophonus endosymbiont of Aleurodicus dispersus]|uniref:translation elongation factor Ts n=1 Tax=Arsenophonus endosymbiont of Aleurodicus dispersus TaxID=235559 RepID=UPI000EADEAFD|nr:translation elongation factor Ts [Arsenophonus endosymbiont of Aleurodicus dispersus]VAY02214.1 Elongation factor Ts [Arsenophonus endosymbiont of Aleurodicus dispersus]
MSGINAGLVKALRERTGVGMMECKKALVEANGDIELAIANMPKLGQAKAANKAGRVATEGVVMAEISADGKFGALLELNCETDFVAKDASFIAFSNEVLKYVIQNKCSNIDELKIKFEQQRIAIVAKIGEYINIRRVEILEGETLGYYLHGARIGVIVSTEGADDELIKHIAMHIAASNPEYVTPADVPADVVAHEQQIQLDIAMQSGKPREIVEKIVTGRLNKFTSQISLIGQKFVMDLSKTVGVLLKDNNATVINFIRFEVGEGIEKVKTDFVAEVAAMSK